MKKYLHIILFLLFAFLSSILLLNSSVLFLRTEKDFASQRLTKNTEGIHAADDTLRVSVVGDIMCHTTQMQYAKVDTAGYDFNPVFREIKKYLKEPDLLMGNLETVIAGENRGLRGYPVFNTPDEFVLALKNTGFDHLFLSNNHIMDMGWKGAERTAEFIDSIGLTRTGLILDESDSMVIRSVKNLKIAVLSFTYGYNNRNFDGKERVLTIGKEILERTINSAKNFHNADIAIVYFHFGDEYARSPNDFQKRAVMWAVNAGADLIFASHTHVIQPFVWIISDKSVFDSVLVTFSLGNFISNQRWRFSDGGIVVNVDLVKPDSSRKVKLAGVSYLPVWVFKGRSAAGKKEYIILPSDSTAMNNMPSYFLRTDTLNFIRNFKDTKRVVDSLGYSFNIDEVN